MEEEQAVLERQHLERWKPKHAAALGRRTVSQLLRPDERQQRQLAQLQLAAELWLPGWLLSLLVRQMELR